jgi:hypothetical protein
LYEVPASASVLWHFTQIPVNVEESFPNTLFTPYACDEPLNVATDVTTCVKSLSVPSAAWFVVFFPRCAVWHDRHNPPVPEFRKSTLSYPTVAVGDTAMSVRRFAERPCALLAFRSVRKMLWSTWHIVQRRFVSVAPVPGIDVVYEELSVAITWWNVDVWLIPA